MCVVETPRNISSRINLLGAEKYPPKILFAVFSAVPLKFQAKF